MEKLIYLDNAATTPVDPRVFNAMEPWFHGDHFGNPSAIYPIGQKAHDAIEQAREMVSNATRYIYTPYFTSGATESNNWVLSTPLDHFLLTGKRSHVITTAIEHPSVLRASEHLRECGIDVTFLPVDKDGFVNPDNLLNAVREETVLVSVMSANNEIGTIQPLHEIRRICQSNRIRFHTDATQYMSAKNEEWLPGVADYVSMSGHKIGAPKGIGLLLADPPPPPCFMYGGGQQDGYRPGTENVPYIVGVAEAVKIARNRTTEEFAKLTDLRDRLTIGLVSLGAEINGYYEHGDWHRRLANNVNVRFDVDSESLLFLLSRRNVCCSAGSACSTGEAAPSHVLKAIGLSDEEARNSLRFTLSWNTTKQDIDEALNRIDDCLKIL